MSLTLYQIASEHRAMADSLQDMDLDEQTINDTLEAESGLTEKSQSVAFVIRNLESFKDQIKQEAKAMFDRAKAVEKRIERVKEYLKNCMQFAGTSKIEHPQFTISIKKNPESVEIFDENMIPEMFMRVPEAVAVPDKAVLKRAMQLGAEIPGARLSNSERLEIK